MTNKISHSGHNLHGILSEGIARKIITFVGHSPRGSDFHINLDVLLGKKKETQHLRDTLANREVMNAIVPLPEIWTQKTERVYLKTFSDELYRNNWDRPVIEPLRKIFVERFTAMNIDAFFDFICLHVLLNFFNDRQQIMFDVIEKHRIRILNASIQDKQPKPRHVKKRGRGKTELNKIFNLKYRTLQNSIRKLSLFGSRPLEIQDMDEYTSIVDLGMRYPEEITDIILHTWNKQPETFWSDMLETIHDTTPIYGQNHNDVVYSRCDWLDWWKKNRPPK